MVQNGEVYKCEICDSIVAVIQGGDGNLVCCEEEMQLVNENDAKEFMAGLPKIGAIETLISDLKGGFL